MFRGYMFTSMKMKTPITRRLPTYRISPIRAIGFNCAPIRRSQRNSDTRRGRSYFNGESQADLIGRQNRSNDRFIRNI